MCTMRREAVGGEALLLRVSVAGSGGRGQGEMWAGRVGTEHLRSFAASEAPV